jgi:hypothetical protein
VGDAIGQAATREIDRTIRPSEPTSKATNIPISYGRMRTVRPRSGKRERRRHSIGRPRPRLVGVRSVPRRTYPKRCSGDQREAFAGWLFVMTGTVPRSRSKRTQTIAVISRVGGQATARRNSTDQRCHDSNVAEMARRHFDGDGVRARRRWRAFSWCGRLANGQSPAPLPPFSARRRTVRLGGGAVDSLIIRRGRCAPALRTAAATGRALSSGETDCRSWSSARRRPGNPASDSQFSERERSRRSPADHRSFELRAGSWKKRPNGSPLRFAQPKFARHDPSPPTRFGLNQTQIIDSIP